MCVCVYSQSGNVLINSVQPLGGRRINIFIFCLLYILLSLLISAANAARIIHALFILCPHRIVLTFYEDIKLQLKLIYLIKRQVRVCEWVQRIFFLHNEDVVWWWWWALHNLLVSMCVCVVGLDLGWVPLIKCFNLFRSNISFLSCAPAPPPKLRRLCKAVCACVCAWVLSCLSDPEHSSRQLPQTHWARRMFCLAWLNQLNSCFWHEHYPTIVGASEANNWQICLKKRNKKV